MDFELYTLDDLYSCENFGAYEINGITRGVHEHQLHPIHSEFAFIAADVFRKKGKLQEADKREAFAKHLQGKVYYSLLEDDVLGDYLPLLTVGFTESLMSVFKMSSESNLYLKVRGFYQGRRNNPDFCPMFVEEVEFNDRIFRRKN